MTGSKRRAFSLVELLVVIGIIALPISMLLPAVSWTNLQARQVTCASNLHQLGTALHSYANSFDGQTPPWSQ